MMRLEISRPAARDLQDIHLYGVGTYGTVQADIYLAELMTRFEQIAQWPLAARVRLPLRPPVRLVRQRAHNVLYTIEGETVTILRVFHHSAHWLDLL